MIIFTGKDGGFAEMNYSSLNISEKCQSQSWRSRAPAFVTLTGVNPPHEQGQSQSELVSLEVMVPWAFRESSEVGRG